MSLVGTRPPTVDERIVINKLGPIDYCDFEINDFMIFTGLQASGKSTIAKSIFFFKNIRNLILKQINGKYQEHLY